MQKLPPSTPSPTSTKPVKPATPEDGPLDSLGKAITDPVKTGAEDEEFKDDGSVPFSPGT